MTIGQLAEKTATDAQTIRYYERQGLLLDPPRTESNYRVYDENSVTRLTFIKRAKEIGFSLNDIKVLQGIADGEVRQCSEIQAFAESRLSKIRAHMADLTAMERTLSSLVNQCALSDKIEDCPILETLTERE
ncbi:MAG: MerR family transcriptional regulator [bacterium]|nr:MerR family transcriptional regulator [bacterium]